jgi:hypothetical protein
MAFEALGGATAPRLDTSRVALLLLAWLRINAPDQLRPDGTCLVVGRNGV